MRQTLGAVRLQAGKRAGARSAFKAALDQQPNNAWALWGLWQVEKAARDHWAKEEAEDDFRRAWLGTGEPTLDRLYGRRHASPEGGCRMTALPRPYPGMARGRGLPRRPRRASIRIRHSAAAILAPLTLLLLAAALAAPARSGPSDPGCESCAFRGAPVRLSGDPVTLPGKPYPYFALRSAVAFTDRNGLRWGAPRGALTDCASIPRALVPLIGQPRSPEFLEAAALHDA